MTKKIEKDLAKVILNRLESKSDHDYRWPRWAASEEAAIAVIDFLKEKEIDISKLNN